MKRLLSLKRRPARTGLWIVFLLILSACSPATAAGSAAYPTQAVSTASTQAAAPAAGASTPAVTKEADQAEAIQVLTNSQLGQILATDEGKTLYANTLDSPEQLHCTTSACTGFWPPYIVSAQPGAVEGLSGSLGTVTRPDGTTQFTYNNQPLYTFYGDKEPGDAKGNGFTDMGGTWHVVTTAGGPAASITQAPAISGGYGY